MSKSLSAILRILDFLRRPHTALGSAVWRARTAILRKTLYPIYDAMFASFTFSLYISRTLQTTVMCLLSAHSLQAQVK